MDSMNGLQLYREMKALRPQIRIIFISALDAAPELTSILPGFRNEDLLAKPVNRDTLAKKVQSAVAESGVYLRGIRT
jgi:two-component SAPR family response regulator